MKKINRIQLIIIINIILFSINIIGLLFTTKVKEKTIYKVKHIEVKFDYYDYVIEFIKKHEGLILEPYKCPAGKVTIGYGHIIKRGEYFTKITGLEAELILRNDFDNCFKLTSENLSINKRFAIAHFIYSFGSTKYNKSTLKKLMENGEYIGNEIIKWCNYKSKGNYIKSDNLLRGRLFELELYYNIYY